MRQILRSLYWRLRSLPLIGPLVERLRNRLRPGSRPDIYWTLHHLSETTRTHGLAISGLRDAVMRALHAVQSIPREVDKRVFDSAHAANLKMDAAAVEAKARFEDLEKRLFAEVYKIADFQNQKIDKQTGDLANRMEFTRTEAMLELRRLARADVAGPATKEAVQVRVINRAKLDAQKNAGAIRLNLGCGHIPVEGYLNVDMRDLPGVDIVAPVTSLPFETGEVEEIYGAHLAEHFPEHVFLHQVLPYWREKLKPGGRLRLELPNGEAMVRAFQAGTVDFNTLALIIMGGQEYEGDFHFAFYNPESMTRVLTAAGFTDIRVVDAARQNGLCLEMEIRAVRS